MESHGLLAPETESAAADAYADVGPTAQTVTREVAKAMEFDRDEYRERVTGDVVATARDALFASLLVVHTGTTEELDSWLDDHPDAERFENGSEDVAYAAWHYVPFADAVVTATYQNEPDAARATLRRIAFGRFYREVCSD